MSLKQQHYRRLMKEQKAKTASVQKIDHPLAKYNAVGQLTCVVCTAPVKNELLWSTHLQSRKHKDNVAALKSKAASVGVKRKPQEQATDELTDSAPKKPRTETNKETTSLPPDFFDASVSKEEVGKDVESKPPVNESLPPANESGPPAKTEGLPPDFFDKKPPQVEKKQKSDKPVKEDAPSSKSSSLPEGFFDDPKKDAKARKVEYKDPELEEWEKFQKSIQKEDDVSDALILEKDLESKEDREEAEVQEQASCFLRAENLRQKQEELVRTESSTLTGSEQSEQAGSGDSSSEDVDLDDLLDWRAKVS